MQTATLEFPWAKTSLVKGNLAIGHLRENLLIRLKINGRIHSESLLTAVGALTGFASQHAFWSESGISREAIPAIGAGDGRIVVARTSSGERYYFGSGLNVYLSGGREGSSWALWPILRGSLVQLGVPGDAHPDVETMYAHVAEKVGSPQFGLPSLAGHMPSASAAQFVRGLWPFFNEIIALVPRTTSDAEPELIAAHWPVVCIAVASQLLQQTSTVLAPTIGAQLVMEAAIAGSKVDPSTVPRS